MNHDQNRPTQHQQGTETEELQKHRSRVASLGDDYPPESCQTPGSQEKSDPDRNDAA